MSSFHGDTVTTTASKLIEVCYDYVDQNGSGDKVNFDFEFKLPNGEYFCVYDWKEYRVIDEDEYIDFHIGANSKSDSTRSVRIYL